MKTSHNLKQKFLVLIRNLLFAISGFLLVMSFVLIIDLLFKTNYILQADGLVKIKLSDNLALIMLIIILPFKGLDKGVSLMKKATNFTGYLIFLFFFSLVTFSIFDAFVVDKLYLNAYLLLGVTVTMIITSNVYTKLISKR